MFDYWWQWAGLIVLIALIALFFILRKKGQNK
jgi:LPXTG-motif cell wall-anchored protein